MPLAIAPTHLIDRPSETKPAPTTSTATFEPRTSPHLDLRIVAFMLVVAVVQLLTFKRPFS